MQGMKKQATLEEAVLDDADVVELVINPGIKRLIVTQCPKNPLKNFEVHQFEEVLIKCEISDEFR